MAMSKRERKQAKRKRVKAARAKASRAKVSRTPPAPKARSHPQEATLQGLLPGVDLGELVQPEYGDRRTPRDRFLYFHKLNPGIARAITAMALAAKEAGQPKWGIKGIFEVLRWKIGVEGYGATTGGGVFAINNNFAPFYARMVMKEEPRLAGFFTVRRQRSGEGHGDE